MSEAGEAPLTAVVLPRRATVAAVDRLWDDGRAVAVVDPDSPRPALDRLLGALRPTHVLDSGGRHHRVDGVGVGADVAAVVATSGTSGAPKLVELSWASMAAAARHQPEATGVTAADRVLLHGPLQFVAGLAVLARRRAVGFGLTVLDRFDLDALLRGPATGHSVTSVVPTVLARMLDSPADLGGWHVVLVGGAALAPELRRDAEARGLPVVATYGLAETWGGCVLDGVPQPGTEVRLAPDGEIELRGDTLMSRYRLAPDDTAAAFTPDGWLRTGDLGVLDPAGHLRVVDRKKDLIVTGGVNVSPVEIEAVLAEHPGIADVAVGGRPDPEWGERVVAYVVPLHPGEPPTLDELRAFARDRLGAAKAPREVVVVDAIPRNPNGKVVRTALGGQPPISRLSPT